MQRRLVIAGGIGLLGAHHVGCAQPAATMRRVGIFHVGPYVEDDALRTPFKQGMNELGWVEGKNVEYRVLAADNDASRLDGLAREFIAQKVDVIFAGASLAVRAAQRATKTIPIVMAGVGDPVSLGFVASLARPGGNITGIANLADELLAKLIQILNEIVPSARRVAIVLNETNPKAAAVIRTAARSACTALGLSPIWVVASEAAQLAVAVAQIVSQRAQAVVLVADPLYVSERSRLQALLLPTRLPVACGHRDNVAAGGLLGYTSNFVANFRYAAKFVDKILKGAKPADLPVEQPTRFELVVNLKTARALGIKIPQIVMLRADEVIE